MSDKPTKDHWTCPTCGNGIQGRPIAAISRADAVDALIKAAEEVLKTESLDPGLGLEFAMRNLKAALADVKAALEIKEEA